MKTYQVEIKHGEYSGHLVDIQPLNGGNVCGMIVNEEGLMLGLSENNVGSYLYGADRHGNIIVGNIVIMKDGYNAYGEPDIVGLDESEVAALLAVFTNMEGVLSSADKRS